MRREPSVCLKGEKWQMLHAVPALCHVPTSSQPVGPQGPQSPPPTPTAQVLVFFSTKKTMFFQRKYTPYFSPLPCSLPKYSWWDNINHSWVQTMWFRYPAFLMILSVLKLTLVCRKEWMDSPWVKQMFDQRWRAGTCSYNSWQELPVQICSVAKYRQNPCTFGNQMKGRLITS